MTKEQRIAFIVSEIKRLEDLRTKSYQEVDIIREQLDIYKSALTKLTIVESNEQ